MMVFETMRPIGSPDKQEVRSQHHVQVGLVAGCRSVSVTRERNGRDKELNMTAK